MARLEYIQYKSFEASLDGDRLVWGPLPRPPIEHLPQIFWEDGSGWAEVNVWALNRAASGEVDPETVKRQMKHICRYAHFLEGHQSDWRHFPVRREDQVLRQYRSHLLTKIQGGTLASTTAANCMNAVIQFYRFAEQNNLVGNDEPMWINRVVTIRFHDASGFKRAMVRLSTDLQIPNRPRMGTRLEDGLLPIRSTHMAELLAFTAASAIEELHLMLTVGFFTGARIGTITSLSVQSLDTCYEDPSTPGIFLLPVGPGTGIATKFSVSGKIMVPSLVLQELRAYASSTLRLLREARACASDKGSLFLTRSGKRYSVDTVNRLVHEMRARAVSSGLHFMLKFHFHQSRATFGTWLMKLLLDCGLRPSVSIGLVKDAMLHKHESTTWGYITFLDNVQGKEKAAAAFNSAFTGIFSRDWNSAHE